MQVQQNQTLYKSNVTRSTLPVEHNLRTVAAFANDHAVHLFRRLNLHTLTPLKMNLL